MGLLRRARVGRALGATGSALLAVTLTGALTVAVVPAPTLTALAATLTGRPVTVTAGQAGAGSAGPTAAPHVERVAGLRWESARPWTGNRPWTGPDGTSSAPPSTTARVAGPAGPNRPAPPTDPIPPGELEPPNRPYWIIGPTPPQCPWPRTDIPAPADWQCDMQPRPDCPQYTGPGVQVRLDAVPGTGSATLSWWNYGDPDVLEWRVAAIEYTQFGSPSPTWQNFQLEVGCYQASHTVTGLQSGKRYEFMLEAIETNHAGRGTALHRGIGHSEVITIG